MVKYFLKFFSDFFQICEFIRCLIYKDVLWFWIKEQDVVFDKIKEVVIIVLVFKYFDLSKFIEGSGDVFL